MSCVMTFPLCFPGEAHYAGARAVLETACERFSHVVCVPVFREETVSAEQYQRLLAHVYLTVVPSVSSECELVVVDPSVSLEAVVDEESLWVFDLVSPDVAARLSSMAALVASELPSQPGLAEAYPHSRASVAPRFAHCVNGGTFDRLHNGHRVLLGMSVAVSAQSLTVGITSDAMIRNGKKTLKELVEPYERRKLGVEHFLRLCNPNIEPKTPAIDDAFGPSIVDPQLSCIVVSEETKSGGEAVNAKRKEANLSTLDVVVVDVWDKLNPQPGSIETKISSTAIRRRIAAAGGGSKI